MQRMRRHGGYSTFIDGGRYTHILWRFLWRTIYGVVGPMNWCNGLVGWWGTISVISVREQFIEPLQPLASLVSDR